MSSGLGHPRTARIPQAPALHGGHLPVQPGAEFLYDFEPPDAGTWWYHSHHRTWEQMARGLYGALIVTLLVDREETVEIAFVADNPGDWLLHCHMPEHSVAGMKTWFRVA